jgi:methylenetetrahydrofolate--tRNA-(uracil-5-)-methyltransferase
MAGQIVGVEGYVESAAMGYLAGMNAARMLQGEKLVPPPKTTAHGALIQYITQSHPAFFQPMNTNFGLFPPVEMAKGEGKGKPAKAVRHQKVVDRALGDLSQWIAQYKILADTSK